MLITIDIERGGGERKNPTLINQGLRVKDEILRRMDAFKKNSLFKKALIQANISLSEFCMRTPISYGTAKHWYYGTRSTPARAIQMILDIQMKEIEK